MNRSSIRFFSAGLIVTALVALYFGARWIVYFGIGALVAILALYDFVRDRSKDDLPENQVVPSLDLTARSRDDKERDQA